MRTDSTYYDIRADFWRGHFEKADSYDAYLELSEPVYVSRWKEMEAALPGLTAEQKERLTGYNRCFNVLVYCSDWCGDCVRQMPMLNKIADAVGPELDMRIIDREESQALKDELRLIGAMRVPVVVFLSEDFHEVGRVGDRMLTAYRRKRMTETGDACSTGLIPPSGEELAAEMAEWVDIIERMLIMLRLSPPLRERYGD
jgi:thiol-disulfide isomerase/thioredoxin